MEGFDSLFNNLDINLKWQLLGSIFIEKIQIENKSVRTTYINPLLLGIASIKKGYSKYKKRDKLKKDDLPHLAVLKMKFIYDSSHKASL